VVVVIYALKVVDDDLIDLEGMEVPRRLLELPGGPLPATWAGLPLHIEVGFEFSSGETALPDRGWRQLAEPVMDSRTTPSGALSSLLRPGMARASGC
jgi:hypothetical protein